MSAEPNCSPCEGSLWKHLKSERLYVVVGHCQLEVTNEEGVLYREINNPNGKLWAHSKDEFLDGRFENCSWILEPNGRTRKKIT